MNKRPVTLTYVDASLAELAIDRAAITAARERLTLSKEFRRELLTDLPPDDDLDGALLAWLVGAVERLLADPVYFLAGQRHLAFSYRPFFIHLYPLCPACRETWDQHPHETCGIVPPGDHIYGK